MNSRASIMEDASISLSARNLVDLKFAIDTEGRNGSNAIPQDLHGSCSGGEYGPRFGSDFLSAVLPFVPRSYDDENITKMEVPTKHVLGCSWRIWPDPNISDEERDDVLAYINSDWGVNDTFYTYIPELMIFAAEEGKNRVNFCRFHNVEFIPARVRIKHYPSAERIKVYVFNGIGGLDVWAVLDSQHAKRVHHYAYALPMLRAYGVEIIDSWPDAFPSMANLMQYADTKRYKTSFICDEIDIERVRILISEAEKKDQLANEMVPCSVIDLEIPMPRLLIVLIVFFAIFFLLGSLYLW